MIRCTLNYLIMTQPGCRHQSCVFDSQPGYDVSFSSQLMKTPFEKSLGRKNKDKKTPNSLFM